MILTAVIEPSRTDGDITLAPQPHRAILIAIDTLPERGQLRLRPEAAPLRIASPAILVADPTNLGHRTAKDHRTRMMRLDGVARAFIIIIGLRINGPCLIGSTIPTVTAIRPVEPELEERAILGDQLMDLRMVFLHVALLSVIVAVAIPRGEIETEFQAMFPASLGELTHHIAFASLPRRILHTIFGGSGRPEAETVVMLGGQDDSFQACGLDGAYPLVAIQICGIKCGSRGVSIAPL